MTTSVKNKKWKKLRVRKIVNRWTRLSPDDRAQKYATSYGVDVRDNNVILMNDTYNRYISTYYNTYKKYRNIMEMVRPSIDIIFNILIEKLSIIPIIDDIARVDNVKITIHNDNVLVYSSGTTYRINAMTVYVSGVVLQDSSPCRFVLCTVNSIDDVYKLWEKLKYKLLHDVIVHDPCRNTVYYEPLKTEKITDNYHINIPYDNNRGRYIHHVETTVGDISNATIRTSGERVNYDKEFDDSLYNDHLVYIDNSKFFYNIQYIIDRDIFINTDSINYNPMIKVFINGIFDIKSNIVRSISTNILNRDKVDNYMLSILDQPLDVLSIFIGFFVRIYRRRKIRVNVDSEIYRRYRDEERNGTGGYKYLRNYVIYALSVLYPDDYNIFVEHNFKVGKIFDFIYNQINTHDVVTVVKSHYRPHLLRIGEDLYNEKLYNIFYGPDKLRVINILKRIISNSIPEQYAIELSRTIHIIASYGTNVSKYIDIILKSPFKSILRKGSKFVLIKPLLDKFDRRPLYIEDANNIFELVSKLRLYLSATKVDRRYEKKLSDLGFLTTVHEERPNMESFKDLQNYFKTIALKEWMILNKTMDKYSEADTLYDVLNSHITNKETATSVYKFLDSKLSFYKRFDISEESVEKEKMIVKELREHRINVYYMLSPEEKYEIDKFDFGSDEWNVEIDARDEAAIYDMMGPVLQQVDDIDIETSDF